MSPGLQGICNTCNVRRISMGVKAMLICKNRVKKPNKLLCLSSSSKQGVREMDVLEFMCLTILRCFSCARDCTTTLIPEYSALTTGQLGSVRMVTARRWDTGRCFAQSYLQNGFDPNILQDQQLLVFWMTQLQHPDVSLRPSTCLSRIHFAHSATQATTEFLNQRNNPIQLLKLVLLHFHIYCKNKIKSTFSISCTNDFPSKLIVKLIPWLILHRKRMLETLNT